MKSKVNLADNIAQLLNDRHELLLIITRHVNNGHDDEANLYVGFLKSTDNIIGWIINLEHNKASQTITNTTGKESSDGQAATHNNKK